MENFVFYRTSLLFLRCVCVIYFFAFFSLYVQIPGLNGVNGILPARSELDSVQGAKTLWDKMLAKPTLLWLAPEIGLNTQYAMELIALVGALISFLGFVSYAFCTELFFAILWVLYQSLFQVNPVFLGFQWDILLLEVGFICIFVAPLWNSKKRIQCPSTSIRFWLVRWLLFRLMFSSGVVKLTSGCPTWWKLTALDVHFESQCIPTPVAWYAHHLPRWALQLGVLGAHFIECVVPLFFLLPIRSVRTVAFYLQILLQVTIMITGNYNFFNLLTIVLCISLLDDKYFQQPKPAAAAVIKQQIKQGKGKNAKKQTVVVQAPPKESSNLVFTLFSYSFCAVLYGVAIFYTGELFGFKLNKDNIPEFKATFDQKQLKEVLTWFVPLTMVYGFASLVLQVTTELFHTLSSNYGFAGKMGKVLKVVAYGFCSLAIFAITLVPYSTIRPASNSEPPILTALKPIYAETYKFHISSGYGLFRHMTGLEGRPEVIIEGADSMEGPWKEYEFKYKPGDVSKPLPMAAPHQPRLDWQMWFAALGNYHQNPWIMSLAYRLLKGQPDVLQLLDRDHPFTQKPPKFIRATSYIYRYTAKTNRDAWWTRKKGEEYFPVFSADHKPLLEYLQKLNLINVKDWPLKNEVLVQVLDKMRFLFSMTDPVVSMWGICFAGFAILLT